MKIFLIYGPPSGGKTTAVDSLIKDIDLGYLSIGQITREEISRGTEKGLALKKYLDNNTPYPLKLITKITEDYLVKIIEEDRTFIIIDGFPKYPEEVQGFFELLDKYNLSLGGVFIINVPLSEILKRALKRKICSFCLKQYEIEDISIKQTCLKCGHPLTIREDDQLETLKRRYDDYIFSIDKTLVNLKKRCRKIVRLDGSGTKEEILQNIKKELM